jgi:hypothetical protein
MAGKYLSRDAIIDTVKGEQRMNAIRRRKGLMKHPVRTVSCGCPDPACGAFHVVVPERTIPSPEECSALLAFDNQSRQRCQRRKTGTPKAATTIEKSVALWSDDSHALVFVTEAPPAETAPAAVGVLVLLSRAEKAWRIADRRRFTVAGKYARVAAELTLASGSAKEAATRKPVVTITESQGGGRRAHSAKASFTVIGSRLKLLPSE